MNSSYQQNVTYIEDLPELDDLEGPLPFQPAVRSHIKESRYPGNILPPGESEKFQKYIRSGYAPPPESGMNHMQHGPPSNNHMQHGPPANNHMQHGPPEYYKEGQEGGDGFKLITMPENSPSCLDVQNHILNCPLCSKFYNNDKTVYVIAIVLLAVISILLLKKVLDV